MKLQNEKLGCSFDVPDRPTVRQQLDWFGASAGESNPLVRNWEGAKAVATDWQCETLPDMTVSLEEISDPKQTEVVIWAGTAVWKHMNGLETVPKNS